MRYVDHVIVTRRPHGWVKVACDHRRKRVAKKWGRALIMHPSDMANAKAVARTMNSLFSLRRYIDLSEQCERQVCRVLRRSGLRVTHISRTMMASRLARGLDPLTGAPRT